MSKAERIGYIDIYRALGILFIVSMHVGFGKAYDHFTHVFIIQMFFFISGFLMSSKSRESMSIPAFLGKKAKSLLIPYLVFGIFFFLVYTVLKGFDSSKLYHLLWMNTDNMPIVGALWFLTALFIGECAYFLLCHVLERGLVLDLAVATIALAGSIIPERYGIILPWAAGPGLVAVGFLHLGRILREKAEESEVKKLLELKWWKLLLFAAILVVLSLVNGYVNIRRELYANLALFWINSLLAVLVLLNVSALLQRLLSGRAVHHWLTHIGRNSIVYMILNEAVIFFVDMALGFLPFQLPGGFAASFVRFALVMLILFPCAIILDKTKLRVFLGKF